MRCPNCRRSTTRPRAPGVQLLGIDVRDEVHSAPADFVHDTGITYPSIYDPPGRSLLVLNGYPRSVVPFTIVLDRAHRVAAVFLTALREGRSTARGATDRRRTADISGRALASPCDPTSRQR
jgi:hypothetical protein